MGLRSMIVYFITGGLFTTLIVWLESSNQRVLSGLAALIPVFTLVAYLFIGQGSGGQAVGRHAWFVLIGTLVSWVPYMIAVAVLAPKIGPYKALAIGLGVFLILALSYVAIAIRFRLFQ